MKLFKLELTFDNEQDLKSTLKLLEDSAEEYFDAFEVKRTEETVEETSDARVKELNAAYNARPAFKHK